MEFFARLTALAALPFAKAKATPFDVQPQPHNTAALVILAGTSWLIWRAVK